MRVDMPQVLHRKSLFWLSGADLKRVVGAWRAGKRPDPKCLVIMAARR